MLAQQQHGVVAHWQLRRLGLGKDRIHHRIRTGRLHRLYRGVYAVGHPAISGHGRWMAAVLACGPGALLSHRSAAALWLLYPTARFDIDVTVSGRGRKGQPGITVHRSRLIHPGDLEECEGIPVTSVARTLFDFAEVAPFSHVEQAFEEAERRRLLDLSALHALCERSRGRRGLKPIATLLAQAWVPQADTRSDLERRFLKLCHEAGLPRPAVNVVVEGFEVDVLWEEHKLIVELDGYEYHRTRQAFERDRARDAALLLAEYRVTRVTDRMLDNDPGEAATRLRKLTRTLSPI